MSKPEVRLIMGYPASGKSTLSKRYQEEGLTYLNRDQKGGAVIDLVAPMIKAIKAGESVVVDNLFATRGDRQPFIDAAYRCKVPIHCSWQATEIEDAQFNACVRMMDRHGKILSPEDIKNAKHPNMFPPAVLFSYRKRFIGDKGGKNHAPKTDEGFATVEKVPFERKYPDEWVNSAIIYDYDETLRESKGAKMYPIAPKEVKIMKGRKEKVASDAEEYDFQFGASNQSGIAKDEYSYETAVACFDRTNELLGTDNITEVMFCPHKVPPITCFCRKPMPGMGVYLIHKYKLDPRKVLMVGDSTSDKTFATRCGFDFVLAKVHFGK